MNTYESHERIAIRMDSGMTEAEATRMTKSELPQPEPESIRRARELQDRMKAAGHGRQKSRIGYFDGGAT